MSVADLENRSDLLDSIFNHIPEDDWFFGLDIYQDGDVGNVRSNNGLITAKISHQRLPVEVRIKIHPAGHCIQWIECTCRKNRISGRYCEHIAAAMFHIDRERGELISRLDQKMPIKPPMATKARGNTAPARSSSGSKTTGATTEIISHLKGAILDVDLDKGGPSVKVNLEIKEGMVTSYVLGVDEVPAFLRQHEKANYLGKKVKNLSADLPECGRAFFVTKAPNNQLEIKKCIALPKEFKPSRRKTDLEVKVEHIKRGVTISTEGREDINNQYYVPITETRRICGSKFFFLPTHGYFPISQLIPNSQWDDLPETRLISGDDVPIMIQNSFEKTLEHGTVYIDQSISDEHVLEAPAIDSIDIHSIDGGWFHLDPKYVTKASSFSMVDLLNAYRKDRSKFVKKGKTWVEIPDYIREIEWEIDQDNKTMKVNSMGLLRLKAMVGKFDKFVGSKAILDIVQNKTTPNTPETPPSLADTNLNLRNYQQDGYSWLWWLYSNGLHGLLADEMGLGKTHQAMALMAGIKKNNPEASFLVVCPTTVLDHWADKINDFCPILQPVKYHGARRISEIDVKAVKGTTIVTSYGVILRDIKLFEANNWAALILDEAHAIKNSDTATYRSVCQIPSEIRIAMSGTPMENHLKELKNIYDFLVPGYLGSDSYFRQNFIKSLELQDKDAEILLQRLLHPLKLRRTKDLVLDDLPEKVEDRRRIELSEEQASIYKDILKLKAEPLIEKLRDENSSIPFLHVFALITKLKQVCDHPALVLKTSNHKNHTSAKFDLLKELLEESIGSGHKIVIFSQYVDMIAIISSYLKEENIDHVTLTGQSRNRGQLISRFQSDPECKVFIGSLLAGGTGIDLTAASVVIHYDRWWNASKENQATDRVHRIGQVKNVQVLKLICAGTLEEKIDQMINTKRDLFERFMDRDEAMFKHLSRKDLIDLLV
jgi:superfamily II DNA or RNA helicase